MDEAVTEVDEVKASEASKSNDNKIFCGAQKLRNFFTKLRRNSFAGEDETPKDQRVVIERKLSTGFCYKLRDEKSAVKTLWPVACREFLFLPEFKVHNRELEENFEVISFIAKGSFGSVYKVRKLKDSQVYALKVLEKAKIIVDDYVQQIKYEVLIQQAISHHPFIATSHEHWQNKGFVYQLSEFISQGEIFQRIKKFPKKLVQFYVAELAIVIDFLHNAGIIYRDLKSENILLDENFHVKLTDFGLSKWLKLGQRTFTICGTRSSMAPEIFAGDGYSHAVDWFALGVLASKMMCIDQHLDDIDVAMEKEAFKDFDEVDDASCAIRNNEAEPFDDLESRVRKSNLDDASKDLLRRLLEKNPQHRLKSLLALQRIAFFHKYNLDDVRHMKISPRKLIEDEAQ